jgi:hypothetical protein
LTVPGTSNPRGSPRDLVEAILLPVWRDLS